MQFPQAVRLNDLLAGARDKAAPFTRVDVDDMRDKGTDRIDDVQKSYRFRARTPCDNALSPVVQLFETITPARHFCTERSAQPPTGGHRSLDVFAAGSSLRDGALWWCGRLQRKELAVKTLTNVTYLEAA